MFAPHFYKCKEAEEMKYFFARAGFFRRLSNKMCYNLIRKNFIENFSLGL